MVLTKSNFLNALFDEGEQACFGKTGYETSPSTLGSKQAKEGQFVTLNPIRTHRKDTNVTVFRNILVECDKGELTEQWNLVAKESSLPFTTAVYSGGKSIHFIISLETPAATRGQYDELVNLIYDALLGAGVPIDPMCKNPSRFTRVGGAVRDNGTLQDILMIGKRIKDSMLLEWLESRRGAIEVMESARLEAMPEYAPLPEGVDLSTFRGELSLRTKNFIRRGMLPGQGGRNKEVYIAAADFANQGYTEAEALDALLPVACGARVGLREAGVRKTIASAYSKAIFNPRIRQ